MRYLLDTDTCIDLLNGVTSTVQRAASISPDDCAISTVSSYELLYGAARSRHSDRERAKVLKFIAAVHELAFDHRAAAEAARVRAELEAGGTPIGPYDILLAGHALAERLTLVTSNTREFARVPGLQNENWR